MLASRVAIVLATAIIVVYAALIPAGNWLADEYFMISLNREHGMPFPIDRMFSWSPRPFSEAVLWLYGRAVIALDRPLISIGLALLWVILYVAIVAGPAWFAGSKQWRWAIGSAAMALFLLGPPIGEMFYWPQAASAYLLAIAGVGAFTLLQLNGDDRPQGRRIASSLALMLAAGSAEAGAITAICVGMMLIIQELVDCRRTKRKPHLPWLIAPVLLGVAVMVIVVQGRVAGPPEMIAFGTYHSLGASLVAAARDVRGVLGLPHTSMPAYLVMLGVAAAGFLALAQINLQELPPVSRSFALALGLLGGAYAIRASAYFQFGTACCDRLDAFRGCLTVLTVLALATGCARSSVEWMRKPHPALGPVLLNTALLAGVGARLPALISDYSKLSRAITVRANNWNEGRQPGASMVFTEIPNWRVVVHSDFLPSGRFTKSNTDSWHVIGVLRFFGKDEIEVVKAP